ncbi:2-oxo acid dehydrogenase subunit E2 [Streptomyces sp. NA04227]|uniref:dihydrolipoamide acetyltransferase family protein n=1 Tax=Streptomyces sp. NA04227 TaxID=2742136 RepID=UPI00159062D5|nr:dihydrolipoamide acetyltransferase family protein [Streptomyces sp. NA04227]QKW07714.1 2-oxo acid dehydrogenase subunit E2 [Streptomyces sp. NA04227]
MAQVLEFALPDLGEGLTEAEIVRWLVQVGDVVAIDQPVVEVETAKAMVEVPCPYGGVVTARFGEEGTELPVGAPLLTVAVGATEAGQVNGHSGTDGGSPAASAARGADDTGTGSGATSGSSGAAGSSGSAGSGAAESSGNVLVGYGTGAAPARRRRVRQTPAATSAPAAASAAAPAAAPAPTPVPAPAPTPAPAPAPAPAAARTSRTVGQAVDGSPSPHGEGPIPVISPLVRRLAREHGIDLRELPGSGPDGLILRGDVENAITAAGLRETLAGGSRQPEPVAAGTAPARPATATARPATAPVRTGTSSAAAGASSRVPLRGVRGAVADKLSRSRREIPDATCWVDADATLLMRARADMNAAGGPKISVIALLARICTAALARFPELNSTVDTEAREVVRLDRVHLGFAAQTERGLVVPVVRDAQERDAESLTAEFARLTESARAGSLTPADLTGGTFTLNNYGVFGVDGSTPIINHPEAAMLGVGRIVPKPWVHEGELAVRQVVQLSLTFDHRVCDGGTAGGFLRYVADCVEQPAVLLRTV